MKPRFPLRMALAVLICLAALTLFLTRKSEEDRPQPVAAEMVEPSVGASIPEQDPAPVAASAPLTLPSPPPGETFAPGHFSGISVRHAPAAGEGVPGDPEPGAVEEITTPSGKKLLRVRTDERHAVPLRPSSPAR